MRESVSRSGRSRLQWPWVSGVTLVVFAALLVACGGASGEGVPEDAVGDTEVDTQVGPDAAAEVEPDSETDMTAEVDEDVAEAEVEPDVGPDGGDDVGPDVGDDTDEEDAEVTSDVEPDTGDDTSAEVVDDAVGVDADVGLPECETALVGDANERWARARQYRVIGVSGGTGRRRHALVAGPSGAIVNPLTGEYVSGPTVGVTDLVASWDLGCRGEVTTEVHVVSDMVVRPAVIAMRPGESFRPEVEGGSGRWELGQGAAVGGVTPLLSIDGEGADARFVAGEVPGVERVRVVDSETDEVVEVVVTVGLDTAPVFAPPWLALPTGASYPAVTVGGSGHFTREASDPSDLGPVCSEEAVWSGAEDGATTLTYVDRFLGVELSQTAFGLAGAGPVGLRSGRQLELWTAKAPGDVDGDGFADAVVGAGELTLSSPLSGGVYVYRGGVDGMQPEPVRVIAGEQRLEQLGSAMAVGDFDGDGQADLAVGGPRFTVGTAVTGRVQVFAGETGRFFSEAAVFAANGERNADLFGHALAACDFDGDGYDDLAVGAYDGENTTVSPVVTNHGAVYLFAGGPEGLTDVSTVIYGLVPGPSGWVREVDLRFGRVLAAGDLDGDGACELAVGSWTVAADNGVVWVYAGGEAGGGLVASVPSKVWRGTRAGRLGWSLEVADLNGDSAGDLVVGQPRWSTSATVADNHGAVRILAGGDWVQSFSDEVGDETAFTTSLLNPGSGANDTNDEWGFGLAIGDVNSDSKLDLLIAGIADEAVCTGCATNAGAVHVVAGAPEVDGVGVWPSQVIARLTATLSTDRQGSALAVLGAVGTSGEVAVLSVAGREDSQGADLGRAMVFKPLRPAGQFGAEKMWLEMPSLPFGWRVGQGLGVVGDLDGDGFEEVVVGAPQAAGASGTAGPQAFSGFATVHRGTAAGFETAPLQTLTGFRRHSAADRWGWDVLRMGDFDGDGRPDLAVVARNEDAATSYGTGTVSTAACNVARTDSGAVAVFGTAGGMVDAQPMLMHFGPQASQVIETVASADTDGDGLSDLVVGSRFWDRPTTGTGDNGGGFEVVLGRARANGTSTTIVCEPARRVFGFAGADSMASALVGVGDLDGDGCEEVAVGIVGSDLLGSNAGAVELFFGAGAGCAGLEVRRLTIAAPVASAGAGEALFAADLDGDGLMELAIGGITHRVGGVAMGGAWVVSGKALAAVAGSAMVRADDVAAVPLRLFGVGGLGGGEVAGSAPNELFGTSVALLPGRVGSELSESPLLAVASQAAVVGGVPVGGVVRLYRVDPDVGDTGVVVIDPRPVMVLGGESNVTLPTAKMVGLATPTGRLLMVGASESSLVAPFSGAVWLMAPDTAVGAAGGAGGDAAREVEP